MFYYTIVENSESGLLLFKNCAISLLIHMLTLLVLSMPCPNIPFPFNTDKPHKQDQCKESKYIGTDLPNPFFPIIPNTIPIFLIINRFNLFTYPSLCLMFLWLIF